MFRGIVICHAIVGTYAVFVGVLSDELRISTNPETKLILIAVYCALSLFYLLLLMLRGGRNGGFHATRSGKYVGLVLITILIASLYSKYVERNEITFLTYGLGALFYFTAIALMRQDYEKAKRTYHLSVILLSSLVLLGALHLRLRFGESGFQELSFFPFGVFLFLITRRRSALYDLGVLGLAGITLGVMMKNTVAVQFVLLTVILLYKYWRRGGVLRPVILISLPLIMLGVSTFVVTLRQAETFSTGNVEFREYLVLEGIQRFLGSPLIGSLYTQESTSAFEDFTVMASGETYGQVAYHNDYLTMMVGGGILGVFSLFLVHKRALSILRAALSERGIYPRSLTLFSAVLIMAIPSLLFNPVLFNLDLSMIFWPLAAFVLNSPNVPQDSVIAGGAQ